MHLKSLIFKNKKSLLFVSILFILFSFFYIQNIYNEYQITKIIQNANKNAPLPHEKYRKKFIYFPFGSGKTVIIPVKIGLLGGDYKVNIVFDFIDAEKLIQEYKKNGDERAILVRSWQTKAISGKSDDYPFSFNIKGYRISEQGKELFYKQSFSYKTKLARGTWASPANTNNTAFRNRYNLTRLSRGKYEFEITDTSPKTENFNNLNTYISILKQDIYR